MILTELPSTGMDWWEEAPLPYEKHTPFPTHVPVQTNVALLPGTTKLRCHTARNALYASHGACILNHVHPIEDFCFYIKVCNVTRLIRSIR